MRIKGTLADYNPCSSQQVYVLLDDGGEIDTSHSSLFLAFTSNRCLSEDNEESSTLVLQTDLSRIDDLIDFCISAKCGRRSRLRKYDTAEVRATLLASHPLELVWPVLYTLASGFTNVSGATFMVGERRLVSGRFLPTDRIAEYSNNIITVVSEYSGEPTDGKWARLPMYIVTPAFGGGLFEAVADLLNIPVKTVQDVMSAVASVATDSAMSAIHSGASVISFAIPPFGTLEYKFNPIAQPYISVQFNLSVGIQFEANAALSTGVWSLTNLLSTFTDTAFKAKNAMRKRLRTRRHEEKEGEVSGYQGEESV